MQVQEDMKHSNPCVYQKYIRRVEKSLDAI